MSSYHPAQKHPPWDLISTQLLSATDKLAACDRPNYRIKQWGRAGRPLAKFWKLRSNPSGDCPSLGVSVWPRQAAEVSGVSCSWWSHLPPPHTLWKAKWSLATLSLASKAGESWGPIQNRQGLRGEGLYKKDGAPQKGTTEPLPGASGGLKNHQLHLPSPFLLTR